MNNNIDIDINTVNTNYVFNEIKNIAKDFTRQKMVAIGKILNGENDDCISYEWEKCPEKPFGNISQNNLINGNLILSNGSYVCYDDNNDNKYDNPEENMKYLLEYALELLDKYGIPYSKIDEYPENFNDRYVSCLGGDGKTFVIHCSKNNYDFEINVIDDCDCNPGLVYVNDIHNTATNEKYNIGCDIGCQNTSSDVLHYFLELLECYDKKQFIDRSTYKWRELVNVLQKYYDVDLYCNIDLSENGQFSINTGNINISIVIKNDQGKSLFYIVPIIKENNTHKLVLIPPHDYKKEGIFHMVSRTKYKNDQDYFKKFCIYNNLWNIAEKYEYVYDKNKFDEFKCILENYMVYLNGEFGYKTEDLWINHKYLRNTLDNNKCEKYHKCHIDTPNKLDWAIRLEETYDILADMSGVIKCADMKKYPKNYYDVYVSSDSKVDDNLYTTIKIYTSDKFNIDDSEMYRYDLIGNYGQTMSYITDMINIVSSCEKYLKKYFNIPEKEDSDECGSDNECEWGFDYENNTLLLSESDSGEENKQNYETNSTTPHNESTDEPLILDLDTITTFKKRKRR